MKLDAKTKRLSIRPYLVSDYQVWREGYLGRKPRQNEFDQGPVPAAMISKAAFRKILKLHQRARNGDRLYIFGIFESKSGRHVGFLDIGVQSRLAFQCGVLGYSVHNQYWGNGYAKEAARAAIRLAITSLKLHRIEAGIDPKNAASAAVASGIGMKFEGVRRSCAFENGAWKDLHFYSATPEDVGLKSSQPSVRTTLEELL